MKTADVAAWAEANLTHHDGTPFRLDPYQRRLVDALRAGGPLRLVTPDEVRLAERRAVKRAIGQLLGEA